MEWLPKFLKGETLGYWTGNIFGGFDKTYIESIFRDGDKYFKNEFKNFCALLAWRNMELSGLSCCGIDNLAVYFSQASRHLYITPFLNLVPGYASRLKPENQAMYTSFKKWWEDTGRRPMPSPTIQYHGEGKFSWSAMKVAMRAARTPVGWKDLVQAVLVYRLRSFADARACLTVAIGRNSELERVGLELMPELHKLPLTPFGPPNPAAAQEKYVICYNPHVGLGNLAVVMVSAYSLAKLTGRPFLLHWNVNLASSEAFELNERPNVKLLTSAAGDIGVAPPKVRSLYFFHMMDSAALGEALELLGCSNTKESLDKHQFVSVSSNMYFAPLLGVNPHTPDGAVPPFPQLLTDLLRPSDKAAKRALDYAQEVKWGESAPVVAIHVRAREAAEDNDDWPTHEAPDKALLAQLRRCVLQAVANELGGAPEWDLYIAATTAKAHSAVAKAFPPTKAERSWFEAFWKGGASPTAPRRILGLPGILRNRKAGSGAADAMAEALLISRADVFVRLVVGTSGFSTFAYFSNALRATNDWAKPMPVLVRSGSPAPNYLVTAECGRGRCFRAPPHVRMASIGWHGPQATKRSCGDVVEKLDNIDGVGRAGCVGLKEVSTASVEEL